MPKYFYQAKEGPERLIQGVIEAPTETAALEEISRQGYVPVKITVSQKEKSQTIVSPSVAAVKRRSRTWVFLFSSHLARLVKTGVPILRSIHLLSVHEKDRTVRAALESIEREVREGKTLARAMEPYPALFSPMYVSMVRAGEASGNLHQALMRLALYSKKQEELISKVRRAMAYPAVLMLAGLASIVFIITFIVPRLEKVFSETGRDLPIPTQVVLGLGIFMRQYWVLVGVVAILAIFFLPRIIMDRLGKGCLDALKLKLPVFGPLAVKIEFSQFSRTLALCFSNNLSFLEAMRVAIPAVDNSMIRKALEDCYQNVEKGGSFGQALKKYALFPELTVQMITIGEESGRVEETLAEIADVYEQEVDEILVYAATFLEPLMILFVGGIIGVIVLSVLLPLFEMNSVF